MKTQSVTAGAIVVAGLLIAPETAAQAAPRLTSVQVTGVSSTTVPRTESISRDQLLTRIDHSGPDVVVTVVVYGYGASSNATLNGRRATSITSTRILSGRMIVGWTNTCTFRAFGAVNNARFVYSDRSINAPWNTMSDSITIR
jgi:uncharacterized membrane-anchored protein